MLTWHFEGAFAPPTVALGSGASLTAALRQATLRAVPTSAVAAIIRHSHCTLVIHLGRAPELAHSTKGRA